jgi:hypothetical protein
VSDSATFYFFLFFYFGCPVASGFTLRTWYMTVSSVPKPKVGMSMCYVQFTISLSKALLGLLRTKITYYNCLIGNWLKSSKAPILKLRQWGIFVGVTFSEKLNTKRPWDLLKKQSPIYGRRALSSGMLSKGYQL